MKSATYCILLLLAASTASADLSVESIDSIGPPSGATFIDSSVIDEYESFVSDNHNIPTISAFTQTAMALNAYYKNNTQSYLYDLTAKKYSLIHYDLPLITTGEVPPMNSSVEHSVLAAVKILSTHPDQYRLNPKAPPVTVDCQNSLSGCQINTINPGSYFKARQNIPLAGQFEQVLTQAKGKRIMYYYSLDDSTKNDARFESRARPGDCSTIGCSILSWAEGDNDPTTIVQGSNTIKLYYNPDQLRVGTLDMVDNYTMFTLYDLTGDSPNETVYNLANGLTPLGLTRSGDGLVMLYNTHGETCISEQTFEAHLDGYFGVPDDCDITIPKVVNSGDDLERITFTDDGQFGIISCSSNLSFSQLPCSGYIYEATKKQASPIASYDDIVEKFSGFRNLLPVVIQKSKDGKTLQIGMLIGSEMDSPPKWSIERAAIVNFKITE